MSDEILKNIVEKEAGQQLTDGMSADDIVGSDETFPLLPDGIGLNLEDIILLMTMKHDTNYSKDDPVFMWLTLSNAFLNEVKKLHTQHNEALTKIITTRTQEYVESVKETTDNFSQVLAQASVEGVRKIFMEHAAALESSKWNARWCAVVVAVSALANLIALAA